MNIDRRDDDNSYGHNDPISSYPDKSGNGVQTRKASKSTSLLNSYIETQGDYDQHVEFKPTQGEVLNEQFAVYLVDIEREYAGFERMWKIR